MEKYGADKKANAAQQSSMLTGSIDWDMAPWGINQNTTDLQTKGVVIGTCIEHRKWMIILFMREVKRILSLDVPDIIGHMGYFVIYRPWQYCLHMILKANLPPGILGLLSCPWKLAVSTLSTFSFPLLMGFGLVWNNIYSPINITFFFQKLVGDGILYTAIFRHNVCDAYDFL